MVVTPLDEAGIEAFLDVGASLHPPGPDEVLPLRAAVRAELDGSCVFASYGRQQLFLLSDDGGRPLGRIAALINPRLEDPAGRPLGQLGYFECIDDVAAAAALFEAGLGWLREQGAQEAIGPMNGGAHRTHRLMTRGFEQPPFLFEPRNPPCYPRLFEACGFEVAHRWFSYTFSRDELARLSTLIDRRVARFKTTERVELLETGQVQQTLARVQPLLDRAWQGHVGYAHLELDELVETFAGLLSITTRRHAGVQVDAAGQDVGFSLMYPDYVDEVRALRGDVAGWGRWLGQAAPRRLVMYMLAVAPERHGTVSSALSLQRGLQHFLEDGFEEMIAALVVEEWPLFRRFKQPGREYALYRRSVA